MIAIIGTSDRPCWLAEACKILLLLLLQRVCLSGNAGALGDERHLIFECTALASLRSRYADLFTSSTDTMRSFFAQPDQMGVFHYVIDCLDLNMIAIIGTSDRPCWLAEACKILLLLLLLLLHDNFVPEYCQTITYELTL